MILHTGKVSHYNALLRCLVCHRHTRVRTKYTESVTLMKYVNYSVSNPGYVASIIYGFCIPLSRHCGSTALYLGVQIVVYSLFNYVLFGNFSFRIQFMMSGRGQRDVSSHKPKLRRFKAKHQRKRFMRAKDPVLAVFMWGVQHTVSNLCVCSTLHIQTCQI